MTAWARREARATRRIIVEQLTLTPREIATGAWMPHARCTKFDPETMFPPTDESGRRRVNLGRAEIICMACPVNNPCRERRYQLGASGVWAGVYYPSSNAGMKDPDRPGMRDQDAYVQ